MFIITVTLQENPLALMWQSLDPLNILFKRIGDFELPFIMAAGVRKIYLCRGHPPRALLTSVLENLTHAHTSARLGPGAGGGWWWPSERIVSNENDVAGG